MKRYFLLCLLFIGWHFNVYGVQHNPKKITIMGIGDSITEGGSSFNCYLYPLWNMLHNEGYDFEFIGPRDSESEIGIIKCCGYGGKTVEFIESKIDSVYTIYPADFVLIHAGHNHFVEENPVPSIINSYKSMINKIRAINPQVCILLAKVIPSGKLPKYSYIPELNKAIVKIVEDYEGEIILVDQSKRFNWKKHTINDKVHPNKIGGERMANVWFKALKNIINK